MFVLVVKIGQAVTVSTKLVSIHLIQTNKCSHIDHNQENEADAAKSKVSA